MASTTNPFIPDRRTLRFVLLLALAVSLYTCFFSVSNSTRFGINDSFDQAKQKTGKQSVSSSIKKWDKSDTNIADTVPEEASHNDTYISESRDPTCQSSWGWELLEEWLPNQKVIITGDSNINCAASKGTYAFCKFSN